MLIIDFIADQAENSVNYMELPLLVLVNEEEEQSVLMRQYKNCVRKYIYIYSLLVFRP